MNIPLPESTSRHIHIFKDVTQVISQHNINNALNYNTILPLETLENSIVVHNNLHEQQVYTYKRYSASLKDVTVVKGNDKYKGKLIIKDVDKTVISGTENVIEMRNYDVIMYPGEKDILWIKPTEGSKSLNISYMLKNIYWIPLINIHMLAGNVANISVIAKITNNTDAIFENVDISLHFREAGGVGAKKKYTITRYNLLTGDNYVTIRHQKNINYAPIYIVNIEGETKAIYTALTFKMPLDTPEAVATVYDVDDILSNSTNFFAKTMGDDVEIATSASKDIDVYASIKYDEFTYEEVARLPSETKIYGGMANIAETLLLNVKNNTAMSARVKIVYTSINNKYKQLYKATCGNIRTDGAIEFFVDIAPMSNQAKECTFTFV